MSTNAFHNIESETEERVKILLQIKPKFKLIDKMFILFDPVDRNKPENPEMNASEQKALARQTVNCAIKCSKICCTVLWNDTRLVQNYIKLWGRCNQPTAHADKTSRLFVVVLFQNKPLSSEPSKKLAMFFSTECSEVEHINPPNRQARGPVRVLLKGAIRNENSSSFVAKIALNNENMTPTKPQSDSACIDGLPTVSDDVARKIKHEDNSGTKLHSCEVINLILARDAETPAKAFIRNIYCDPEYVMLKKGKRVICRALDVSLMYEPSVKLYGPYIQNADLHLDASGLISKDMTCNNSVATPHVSHHLGKFLLYTGAIQINFNDARPLTVPVMQRITSRQDTASIYRWDPCV